MKCGHMKWNSIVVYILKTITFLGDTYALWIFFHSVFVHWL